MQRAVQRLHGAYAIAVFCDERAARVVGARAGCPLVVGVGKDENFLASDAMALAGTTDRIVYLEEGDVADDRLGTASASSTPTAARCSARCAPCKRSGGAAELGPYRHYMQKEIFEQPRAIADTLEGVGGDHAGAVRRRAPTRSSRTSTRC